MSTTINDYIKTFPDDVRPLLEKLRQVIQRSAPKAVETFSYGIPTFDLEGKHLVHFAGFRSHIGFYPTPSGIAAFKSDLAQYKGAKGSVQFPVNEPIPYDLVEKIVAFRVKEISLKKNRKKA